MAFHSTFSPNFDSLITVGAMSPTTAIGNNTLACWVNFNSLATDGEIIEVNANGGGNGAFDSAILWSLASTKLEFTQRTSTTNRDFVATFTVTTNTWIHVALTWDGTNLLAFANGVQIGSNTTGAMAGTRGNFGGLQLGPCTGDIQDGVFYSAALSIDEIAQLYRARCPKRRNNLLAHLPCYPGANRGLDYSGNAVNFSNQGTPVDSTIVPPPVGWGSLGNRIVLPASAATAITASGLTNVTGAATVGKTAAVASTGTTNVSGTADMQVGKNASGVTNVTGAASMSINYALTAAGLTNVSGAASASKGVDVTASGLVTTSGNAAVSGSSPTGTPLNVHLWRRNRRGR